jgi:hypothetical protein
MLYPSDSTDPDAPGKHRAMIEQIFAAKELGINACGEFSTDRTLYKPLEFQIVSISNPSVTVRNADANGNTFI